MHVVSNDLRSLVSRCPLGYHDGKLITTRSTSDADVIEWLQQLKELAERPNGLATNTTGERTSVTVAMQPVETSSAMSDADILGASKVVSDDDISAAIRIGELVFDSWHAHIRDRACIGKCEHALWDVCIAEAIGASNSAVLLIRHLTGVIDEFFGETEYTASDVRFRRRIGCPDPGLDLRDSWLEASVLLRSGVLPPRWTRSTRR